MTLSIGGRQCNRHWDDGCGICEIVKCREACGLESSLSESAFNTVVQSIFDDAFVIKKFAVCR